MSKGHRGLQGLNVAKTIANYMTAPTFFQGEGDDGLRQGSEQDARLRGQLDLVGRLGTHIREDRSELLASAIIAA